MSDLAPVLAHVDRHREAHVARLIDYVRHPSISAQGIGMREVAAILLDHVTALGFAAELVETAGHPTLLARRTDHPGGPTILLYGHYDVQPPEPLELWHSPPFEPTVRDGRIWARGVGDNKGQHFAQLLAIEAHLAVHGRLPCNVVLLLEGEEEVGSPNLADFVRTHRDRLGADLVVTADGPMHASGRPVVMYGVRGVVSFELRCRHASHDVHSGNFGGVVPNPIWTIVHALASMKNERGEITIEGFGDEIVPPTGAERDAAARLPFDEGETKRALGLDRLDAPEGRSIAERLMFHPTFTINGIGGGYAGPGSKTVLPAEAFAKCDIRLVEAMTPEGVLAKVEAHLARHAPDVGLVRQGGMLPSRTPFDSPFGAAIRRAVVAAQGVEPYEYPSLGGSLPDYVFTKILGVPAFVVPYANHDEANHAPNENLTLDCFHRGIRTGAALLAEIGRTAPGR